MYTGMTGMQEFGLLEKVNGIDHLPYWDSRPCNSLSASEGSFFPPRDVTKSNFIFLYDKDMCRTLPLEYKGPTKKHGECFPT